MIIAITGRPGVGKTTLFFKVVNKLKESGVEVYGFYCPEVRVAGRRVGFRIVDLRSGRYTWLALVQEYAQQQGIQVRFSGKRIGRYVVVEDAAELGIEALRKPESSRTLLAIDEIGPMELSLPILRRGIIEALNDAQSALLVIHRNLGDYEVLNLLRRKKAQIYTVTESNRETLSKQIVELLRREFAGHSG